MQSADMADGLLVVDLVREVPEAMKPKKISVNGRLPSKLSGPMQQTQPEYDFGPGKLVSVSAIDLTIFLTITS